MKFLEVSGAVQHIYIYIYTYMSLGGKGLTRMYQTHPSRTYIAYFVGTKSNK
jgi:hypothetical protein